MEQKLRWAYKFPDLPLDNNAGSLWPSRTVHMIIRVTETKTRAELIDRKELPARALAVRLGKLIHTPLKRFGGLQANAWNLS